MKSLKHVVKVFIYIVLIMIISNINVYAVDDIILDKFIPQNIQGTMDGGKLDMKSILNDDGEYEIHIAMNTLGLEKGYYTAFIYENTNSNFNDYKGMHFHIENMGDKEVSLNFNVIKTDGSELKIADDKFVLLQKDDSNLIEKAYLTYGAVDVENGFTGTMYIPFDNLNGSLDDNQLIASWGISITTEEDEDKNIKFNNFAFINKETDINKYIVDAINIEGDSEVMIPSAGESIAQYSLRDGSDDVYFELEDNYENVSIDKAGLLTVSKGAKPQYIRIVAVDNNIGDIKEVQLYEAWSTDMKYEDGVKMGIPQSGQINSIYDIDESAFGQKIIMGIRVLSAALFISFISLFFYWRKNYII